MATVSRKLGFFPMFLLFLSARGLVLPECKNITIVTRAEWGARPTKSSSPMRTPVGIVFIHHTATIECWKMDTCAEEMRSIQNCHMDNRSWDDIGYNFLIGQDGRVYEGRGWDRDGAHTKGWNGVSVAFSVMGDFTDHVPNDVALEAINLMIQCGVDNKKLTSDYKLYGHRDVRSTECPGNSFYDLIQSWSHYDHNKPVKPTSNAVCQMPLNFSILMLVAALDIISKL